LEIKISVITPSIRPEGLKIVASALKKQSFIDWEWIVCSSQKLEEKIRSNINNIVPFKFIGNPPLQKGMFWDLNYSYNKLIEESKGELLISLQDWIYINPDGLEKFWISYQNNKKGIYTGVGDQYEGTGKYNKPNQIKVWIDPRRTTQYGTFYELDYFGDIEFNWCAIPKNTILSVGCFDEGLDFKGFGMDAFQVLDRINDLKKNQFYIDQTNESFSIYHNRDSYGGEDNWNKHNLLKNGYLERKIKLIEADNWPELKDFGRKI
jgi:hypothetical protein